MSDCNACTCNLLVHAKLYLDLVREVANMIEYSAWDHDSLPSSRGDEFRRRLQIHTASYTSTHGLLFMSCSLCSSSGNSVAFVFAFSEQALSLLHVTTCSYLNDIYELIYLIKKNQNDSLLGIVLSSSCYDNRILIY